MTMRAFYTLLLSIFIWTGTITAQQVMMQGWYWNYPKTAQGYSWADTLSDKAMELSDAGFTHVWFPPHAIASSGPQSNGYDPQDLFIGNQTSGLGTRAALDDMLNEFVAVGIDPVGDMIYNHRDGGAFESNPAVKDYITVHMNASKSPYPSDRFRCVLPLGGSTGNGAGTYYFKISSKTQQYGANEYKFYATTNVLESSPFLGQISESEPNGGGDCNQPNNTIVFNQDMISTLYDFSGCYTDEFALTVTAADFNSAGDSIYIYLNNVSGGYSDHRIYGIYSSARNQDIVSELIYETYTDHNNHPSGRGGMNFEAFTPNSNNTSTTGMSGDFETPYFFYDYDQSAQVVRDTLFEWTAWNWEELSVRGLRMDAIKHFPADFVGDLLDDMHDRGYDPSMVVGEWFSNNSSELSGWLDAVLASMDADTKAAIQPKIFDFTLRENLRKACDDGFFDVRNLFNGSLYDISNYDGFHIVTFVNNHDFRDASGFNSLAVNDLHLAYAYILLNNQLGVPTVFYPDYYGGESIGSLKQESNTENKNAGTCYKDEIDELIGYLQDEIQNANTVTYLNNFGSSYTTNITSGFDSDFIVYQLSGGIGGEEIVVAINFGQDPVVADQELAAPVSSGAVFTDISGRSNDVLDTLDNSIQLRLDLPARSFAVYKENAAVLPVEWLDISASAVSDHSDRIQWAVNQDGHQENYLLQKKNEDQSWITVHKLSAESDAGIHKYHLDVPSSQLRKTYYRVIAQDVDGYESYSAIVDITRSVEFTSQISISPNPASGKFSILNTEKISGGINLYNSDGSFIAEIDCAHNGNRYDGLLPAGLSSGVYYIKFASDGIDHSLRLLVN